MCRAPGSLQHTGSRQVGSWHSSGMRDLLRAGLIGLVVLVEGCGAGDEMDAPATQRVALSAAGEVCSTASDCEAAAPFCVDGVCCTTACDATCVACVAALKESQKESGTCGQALAGLDPHSDCATDPVASCGKTGACNGKGACAIYPQGTSCATQSGDTNQCVIESAKGKICSGSGSGACYDETSPSGVPCAPYRCKNGSCAFPCQNDTDCVAPFKCSNGVCGTGLPNGVACTSLADCQSGVCIDGVCCDSNCNGQCQSCKEPGKLGVCTTVTGTPVLPRPDCGGTAPCKGTCAGNPDKCNYPGNSVACGTASCSGDVSTPAPTCDGTGKCAPSTSDPCSPFGCNASTGVCNKSCSSASDCAQGGLCDTTTGNCTVASTTCEDAYTVKLANGQTQSCSPYKCVGGKCQQQCSTSGDCAPGFACSGKSCLPESDSGTGGGAATGGTGGASSGGVGGSGASQAAPSSDDGGCGCRLAGRRGSQTGAWLLVLFAALWLRRRD